MEITDQHIFSHFPTDIVRIIFEHAANIDQKTAFRLVRVSTWVADWIRPYLYRTIILSRTTQIRSYVKCVPEHGHKIEHLCLDFPARVQTSLLDRCTNLKHLCIHNPGPKFEGWPEIYLFAGVTCAPTHVTIVSPRQSSRERDGSRDAFPLMPTITGREIFRDCTHLIIPTLFTISNPGPDIAFGHPRTSPNITHLGLTVLESTTAEVEESGRRGSGFGPKLYLGLQKLTQSTIMKSLQMIVIFLHGDKSPVTASQLSNILRLDPRIYIFRTKKTPVELWEAHVRGHEDIWRVQRRD
ncbi:hypothetical protein SISNIDRAFT_552782 [Sistotremastrum niveocremeum HHB9708]|uniref:F-box domain-containing protein n=2 Tax=Sistotremastraceae TaxID=3402574 RepID=A0A164NUZ9_9AGAM|nr:hypothetical protein SISNIDRAFT_552782 [Sistotremastrum niveocremeum HHB9708]KZT40509.1 hypothetical protein SISSUDRAFT_1044235 [Sistotremastrum suecicum HHB10207 ss-3]